MSLPGFNDVGDLPIGVHQATLEEVLSRFGSGTPQRFLVSRRLERILTLARSTGKLARFVVFGSYVTAKTTPGDVDIFILMDDDFDVSIVEGEARVVFDHLVAENYEGASVFWMRRTAALGGEDEAIAHWQIKRNGSKRGIVEVIDDDS